MKQFSICINTTGTSVYDGHRIIELAAIELENKKITGRNFHCYLQPNREIDETEISKHGITNEFLIGKPLFARVMEELDNFISDGEILAPNRDTLEFIANEFALHRSTPQNHSLKINSERIPLSQILTKSKLEKFLSAKENFYLETKEIFGALLDAEIQADAYLSATKNEIIVNDITELLTLIKDSDPNDLFRGVSDRNYKLLPSLFRHSSVDHKAREDKMMWVFRAQAKPYLEKYPENEIQWLTLAQHHGLPTRLLDWSFSPLVACFFATRENPQKDGAIYVYEARKYGREEKISPVKIKEITPFLPSHGTKRLTAQSGAFTIHPDSEPEFDNPVVKKYIIPKSQKSEFTKTLSKYGINNSTMFPDLDGLSAHLKSQNNY